MTTSTVGASQSLPSLRVSSRRRTLGVFIVVLASTIGLIVAAFSLLNPPDPQTTAVMFGTFTITFLLVFLMGSILCFGTPTSLSVAFLLVLAIFHAGHQILFLFGYQEVDYFLKGALAKSFAQASWTAALAMTALGLGVSFSLILGGRSRRLGSPRLTMASARTAGRGLLIASGLALLFLIYKVGNIFAYSREELFAGVGDTRGLGLILMIFPSAVMLLTVSVRTRLARNSMLVLAALSVLALLLLGYRTEALMPALIGLVIWVKCGFRLPMAVLVVGIAIVLISIPTVRYLRTLGAYDQMSQADIARSLEQARVGDAIAELGGTTGIVADTLVWVPAKQEFQYGGTYLRAILDSIPNLGANARKSERASISGNIPENQLLIHLSPADWYIYKTNRWKFYAGQGSGYSSVAEAYLNFGYVGVVVVFFLTGVLLGHWDRNDITSSRWFLVAISVLMWPLVKSIRNDFSTFAKPVIFMIIVIAIWLLIESLVARRSPQARAIHQSEVSRRSGT